MSLRNLGASDTDSSKDRKPGDCSVSFKNTFDGSAVFNFYLTGQCNMHCAYCFEDRRDLPPDMSAKEVRQYIERISREIDGEYTLVMFGGEPTLRWDFVLIAFEARETFYRHNRSRFVIFSNGIALNSDRLSSMANRGGELFISYDGGNGNSDLRFGARAEALEAAVLRNIREAIDYNVPVTVAMSLGNHNVEKALPEMQALHSRVGVSSFRVNNIRRYPFCSKREVWNQQRSLALEWARSNDVAVSWAKFEQFGSRNPTWYISSRSVRLIRPFENATWNATAW